MAENYFKQLYDIDVRSKTKQKNSLSYLSWASAWSEVKKLFPNATFKIYEESIDIVEKIGETTEIHKIVERPWFDDGTTGWVKTGVTINIARSGWEIVHPLLIFLRRISPSIIAFFSI